MMVLFSFKFPLPSTTFLLPPMPYRCSGVPAANYRRSSKWCTFASTDVRLYSRTPRVVTS